MKTSLREEKIKPGLNVLVDWNGRGHFEKAIVIRKLRKNWLVRIPHRDCSIDLKGQYHSDRFPGRYSIPPQRLTLDPVFTKEGRPLMATSEDKQYMFSKEHVGYFNSMIMKEGEPT